jgi:colicin import membrane protein
MNDAPVIDLPTLEEFAETAPALLFDSEKLEAFMKKLRAASDTSLFSIGTESGREKIRSAAYRVSRFKNALDKARTNATEGLRKKQAEINKRGNEAVEKLETLQDEIKRPVEQWEQQDRARIAEIQAKVNRIIDLGEITAAMTADDIERQLKLLQAIEIDSSYAEQAEVAHRSKSTAERDLKMALEDRRQREAEQAELAELRRKQAERDAKDAAERAERERAEAEAARKAEEERRIEAARLAAAEAAKVEAERKAAEEAARIQREADERVAAAQRAADEKIAAERREREEKEAAERRAREAAEAKAAADRAEEERKASSVRRQNIVRSRVIDAMIGLYGIEREKAEALFRAIAKNEVPHLKVEF